jgi:hypothetical protein
MNTISIGEFIVISGLTIIVYVAIKAAYDTWFK